MLAAEANRLLAAVASVRGVASVEDRLQIYQQPGDHPALQGGRPHTGEQSELWQQTWSPTVRLLVATAIAVPTLRVAAGRGGLAGLALGALGVGLVARELVPRRGQPRRSRSPEVSRPVLATGAPVHDVTIPIHRPRYEEPEVGRPGVGL